MSLLSGEEIPLYMREIVQRKFLNDIIGSASSKSNGWMILVLDDQATRVISSALTMYDIMERKITIVEQLHKARQPFPDMDVIYLVSSTTDSFKKIVADFQNPSKVNYGNVHIFTLDAVSDKDMQILKRCEPLLDRLQTFTEAHIDFISAESHVFHCDFNQCLSRVFKASDAQFGYDVACKLSSLCITLNEAPIIRYQQSSDFCKAIATFVHKNLIEYKMRNPLHWTHGDASHTERERGVLLILDRSFDPLTPVMHEYTYQSLAQDLLSIKDNVIPVKMTTNAGVVEEKEALLGESDDLWVELRHMHLAKVIQTISARMKDIIQNNNNATLAKGGDKLTLSELASAIKHIPEFTQTLSKLNQHISIAQQCMESFTKKCIWDVSQLEQFMSTGVDNNNTLLKKATLMQELVDMLENPKVDQVTKARILAVFFVTQSRITSADERGALVRTAKIDVDQQSALKNLEKLSSGFSAPTLTEKVEKKSKGFFTQFFNSTSDDVVIDADGDIADSRHVSVLHSVLEKLLNGILPADKYPAVDSTMLATKPAVQSVRRVGAQNKFAGKRSPFTGSRTIVFVAGGLSYAEMRIASDEMIKSSKEVIVGGTHLITPDAYLDELKTLHLEEKTGASGEYEIVHV